MNEPTKKPIFDFLEMLHFKSGEAILSRTAGRAVCSSINILAANLIGTDLRMRNVGAVTTQPTAGEPGSTPGLTNGGTEAPGSTLDGRNAQDEAARGAQDQETAEQEGQLEKLGEERDKPLVVAARLKVIRDSIARTLSKGAAKTEAPAAEGGRIVMIDDPFHIAQSFAESLNFLCRNQQDIGDASVKAAAEQLGISEDDARMALSKRPAQRQQFMARNRDEILKVWPTLVACDRGGFALSSEKMEQVHAAFDALEPVSRIKLLSVADNALFNGWQREIQLHVDGNLEAMSNMGLLDGVRRQVREQYSEWMKDERFARSFKLAIENGARMPTFKPMPKPATATAIKKAA